MFWLKAMPTEAMGHGGGNDYNLRSQSVVTVLNSTGLPDLLIEPGQGRLLALSRLWLGGGRARVLL